MREMPLLRVVLTLACPDVGGSAAAMASGPWQLRFRESFDGSRLDESRWRSYSGAPDGLVAGVRQSGHAGARPAGGQDGEGVPVDAGGDAEQPMA